MFMPRLVILILAFIICIPLTAYAQSEPARLQPLDEIEVSVYGEDDLSGAYTLDETGILSIPLIGEVMAKGLSTAELKSELEQKFKDGFLKNPDITIKFKQSRIFYIMGEVNEPGEYAFEPGLTIRKAAAMAGGFTYRANEKRSEIVRQKGQSRQQSFDNLPPEYYVEPGDVIIIKERFF